MHLPARIGLITLACRDVERMTTLFRDLGWPETPESDEHHRTFQCTNGVVIALYAALNYDAQFGPVAAGFRGVCLSVNLASFDECLAVYETLKAIDGVELLGQPTEAFWGGGSVGEIPKATCGTSRGPRARQSTTAVASRSLENLPTLHHTTCAQIEPLFDHT